MKYWVISISDKLEPELKKKFRRLLKPVLSVGQPSKCEFCETMTTWTVNRRAVCPACQVKYDFLAQWKLPDKCEVCSRQGEWCTDGGERSLCYIHRDEWFHWKMSELDHIDSVERPEEWRQAWEKGWARFIACMKER